MWHVVAGCPIIELDGNVFVRPYRNSHDRYYYCLYIVDYCKKVLYNKNRLANKDEVVVVLMMAEDPMESCTVVFGKRNTETYG